MYPEDYFSKDYFLKISLLKYFKVDVNISRIVSLKFNEREVRSTFIEPEP